SGGTPYTVQYGFPLIPATDTDTATMLSSGLGISGYSGGFTTSQKVASGTYDVYVWTIENYVSHYRDINFTLNGTTVATQVADMNLGQWAKFGPYRVTATNGQLTLGAYKSTKGDPHITGMAIFAVGSQPANNTPTVSAGPDQTITLPATAS